MHSAFFVADERAFKVNTERSRAAGVLICSRDQFAQAVQSLEDSFARRCDRGRQIRCNAVFREVEFNLCQSGLTGFHGISAGAAVYVDIDESRSQYQTWKIQSAARRNFRRTA